MANYDLTQTGPEVQDILDKSGLLPENPNTVIADKVDKAIGVTYAELVALKAAGTLKAGQYYRITDYVATTVQAETRSAGNPFDIVVAALDGGTLDENAWAVKHEGDTYFENAKLEAWKLKYCIDNDTARFAWADTVNGKGVIYEMEDEWGNRCPYDFKGIQFKRYKITAYAKSTDLEGQYLGFRNVVLSGSGSLYPSGGTISTTDTAWRFTFDGGNGTDMSLTASHRGNCHGNTMAAYRPVESSNQSRQWLNNIVFVNTRAASACYGNHFKERCHSMSFGNNCYANTFGQYCQDNTFGQSCLYNTFGQNCYSNTFGQDCSSNTFGQSCQYNTFGQYCQYNTFGQYCQDNTFGQSCSRNTFGQYCQDNTFGQNCQYNTFWQNCYSNTFGQYCQYNTFGQDCSSNTFGQYCQYNTFGQNCCNYEFSNPDNLVGFKAIGICITDVYDEDEAFDHRIYAVCNDGQQRSVLLHIEENGDASNIVVNQTVTMGASQVIVYTSYEGDNYPRDSVKCEFTEQGRTVSFAPFF